MEPVDQTLLWLQTLLFGVVIYWVAVLYIGLSFGGASLAVYSEAFAVCGGILIGSSFALSGLGYFLNIFDRDVRYRKMLGICGYFAALAYSISLVIRFPQLYATNFFTHVFDLDVIMGLAAMTIFTFMALISWQWAIKLLGKSWRPLLRLGYLAYLFLIIRAIYVEGGEWRIWAIDHASLPPARLLLTLFACAVILLRIGMEISLRGKKKIEVAVKI